MGATPLTEAASPRRRQLKQCSTHYAVAAPIHHVLCSPPSTLCLWPTPFSTPHSSLPMFSLHFYRPFSHRTLIPCCVFYSTLFSVLCAPFLVPFLCPLSLLLILHAQVQSVHYLHLTFCTVPAFPLFHSPHPELCHHVHTSFCMAFSPPLILHFLCSLIS